MGPGALSHQGLAVTPQEFFDIYSTVEQPKPVFYRLYHNEIGEPLFYSMEDLPGLFVDIDAELFARSPRNVRVKNGRIIHLNQAAAKKLVPAATGTTCDPRDVCVIINDPEPAVKWSVKTYDPN